MKRRHALMLPLAAAAGAGAQAAVPAPGERVQWPEVTLLDGGRFGPADAAGRAVVVVFWSVTCPFCRRHNPHVEKLHRAARAQRKPLVVLSASRDADAAEVRRHAAAHGYSFPITLDAPALATALSPRRLVPLTVTVDRQGRLRQVCPGEMFEEDVMELLELAS